MRKYKIHVDIYDVTLNLCVGPRESFGKMMFNKYPGAWKTPSDANLPPCNGRYRSVEEDGMVAHYVWMEDFNWSIGHQGILAHELLHFVFSIHEARGFTLSDDSEESYTYTFQHVMCEAWRKLRSLR